MGGYIECAGAFVSGTGALELVTPYWTEEKEGGDGPGPTGGPTPNAPSGVPQLLPHIESAGPGPEGPQFTPLCPFRSVRYGCVCGQIPTGALAVPDSDCSC